MRHGWVQPRSGFPTGGGGNDHPLGRLQSSFVGTGLVMPQLQPDEAPGIGRWHQHPVVRPNDRGSQGHRQGMKPVTVSPWESDAARSLPIGGNGSGNHVGGPPGL